MSDPRIRRQSPPGEFWYRQWSMAVSAGWLWLGLASACGDPDPAPPLACNGPSQCPSRFHCGPAKVCVGDVLCNANSDCCLGERCEDGVCRARQACSAAAQCLDPATACVHGYCAPAACGENSPCPAGRTCLWGLCADSTPCGGHCPAGQACAPRLSQCVKVPSAECPSGQLPVLSNEIELMPEGCASIAPQVTCQALPPLPEGDRAPPGALVGRPGELLHFAYDRSYGDLVLARYATAPPFQRKSLRVLSGLPVDAPIVAALSGPRGGVAAPGPNHGSSLAVATTPAAGGTGSPGSKGDIHLALRDDTADALRYARLNALGAVMDHQVAAGPGLGTRVAIVLSAAGYPVILAFSPAAPHAVPPRSARLTAYAAKSAAPMAAGDWVASEVDSEVVSPALPPCGGPCPSGQVCTLDKQSKSHCTPVTTNCTACILGQVCAAGLCRTEAVAPPQLDEELQGRGVSLDMLALATGQIVAVAYSSSARNLAIYQSVGSSWVRTIVPPLADSTDSGRFVKMAAGLNGQLWLAGEDSQRGRLAWWRQQGNGWQSGVWDGGDRADGHHRVGADVAIAVHPFGSLLIAHQDTRRADLLVQRGANVGKSGLISTLATHGAAGFAPTIAQVGSKAWVVAAFSAVLGPDGVLRHQVDLRELVWGGE